jgi:hypothetical protein
MPSANAHISQVIVSIIDRSTPWSTKVRQKPGAMMPLR